jgi:uncharacterized protein DUF6941
MRVEWAIPCRYLESEGGTATIVGAGIDTFFVPDLPATVGFMLAMKLVAPDEDWQREFRLVFKILGPTATVVREESVTLGAHPGTQLFETWERGGIIPSAHQFEVAGPGAYSLEILINDEPKHSVPFFVHHGRRLTAGRMTCSLRVTTAALRL